MQLELDLGTYSPERGLELRWQPGYVLTARAHQRELVISGNEQGLRSLAQHLLTLADARVPHGVHAHLEPGLELEDDSVAIVIEKAAEMT
jgi:hypothetical protein